MFRDSLREGDRLKQIVLWSGKSLEKAQEYERFFSMIFKFSESSERIIVEKE